MNRYAASLHNRWTLAAAAVLVGILAITVLSGSRPRNAIEAASAWAPHFATNRIADVLGPIAEHLEEGAFPGAAVAFGVGDDEVYAFGMGAIGWTRNAAAVDPGATRYDLASLTKVVATASAVMLLVDEGRMSLDDPVSLYLSNFDAGPKAAVTIRHLLSHTSGLPEGAVLRGRTRGEKLERATKLGVYPPAGARVAYSDVGYVLLWEAAERAAGEPLPAYLRRRLFEPLAMHATGFSPGLACEECAPTGRLRDQSLYRGKPFDPIAQDLGGIAGNAGLFSTASDLARFAAMIANGGDLHGARILSEEVVREFTTPPPGGDFALGWEVRCTEAPAEAEADAGCFTARWIGHTGWTGTFIAVDPVTRVWLVLLTNRTYEPKAPNRLPELRREVFARAASR
ncbi:MAG TPA: serine hydrolase domain-containing protein [Longimicrobiaceae bacterium]|nr:serine hydrolase domain-containing protein [Longimicrobiaceae bacterium]